MSTRVDRRLKPLAPEPERIDAYALGTWLLALAELPADVEREASPPQSHRQRKRRALSAAK